jgi:hypothetical protein
MHMKTKHLVRAAVLIAILVSAVAVSGCMAEASVSYSSYDGKTPSDGDSVTISLDGRDLGCYPVGATVGLNAPAGRHTVTVYDAADGGLITEKEIEIRDFATQYWNLWDG